jgi:hypothetical protein
MTSHRVSRARLLVRVTLAIAGSIAGSMACNASPRTSTADARPALAPQAAVSTYSPADALATGARKGAEPNTGGSVPAVIGDANTQVPPLPPVPQVLIESLARLDAAVERYLDARAPILAREVIARDEERAARVAGAPADEIGRASRTIATTAESAAGIRAELSVVRRRIEALRQERASPVWEAAARAQRISEYATATQELALRGSVQAFRAQAELEWELVQLRELAGRSGLDRALVPDKDHAYRLLDHHRLVDLRAKWKHTSEAYRRANVHTLDAYQAGLTGASHELDRIADALAHDPVNLAARFSAARPLAPDDAVWLASQQAAREQQVARLEAELLQLQLARDGDNLAVIARLFELDRAAGGAAAVRMAAIHHFAEPGSRLLSQAIVQLFRDRVGDPLMAEWQEVVLRRIWDTSRGALPGPARSSFPQWLVSQLSDAELFELAAWHRHVVEAIKRTRPAAEVSLRTSDDLSPLQDELDLVAAEVRYRQQGGRAAMYPLPDNDPVLRALMERPVNPSAVPEDLRPELWRALTKLEARVDAAPEIKRLRGRLALDGFSRQVRQIESDVSELAHERARFASAMPESQSTLAPWRTDGDIGNVFLHADESIWSRIQHVREGVGEVSWANPELARRLRKQLRKAAQASCARSRVECDLRDQGAEGDTWVLDVGESWPLTVDELATRLAKPRGGAPYGDAVLARKELEFRRQIPAIREHVARIEQSRPPRPPTRPAPESTWDKIKEGAEKVEHDFHPRL